MQYPRGSALTLSNLAGLSTIRAGSASIVWNESSFIECIGVGSYTLSCDGVTCSVYALLRRPGRQASNTTTDSTCVRELTFSQKKLLDSALAARRLDAEFTNDSARTACGAIYVRLIELFNAVPSRIRQGTYSTQDDHTGQYNLGTGFCTLIDGSSTLPLSIFRNLLICYSGSPCTRPRIPFLTPPANRSTTMTRERNPPIIHFPST